MSDLTNAVERIGRAGNENSRASEKLRDACLTLANFISDTVIRFSVDIPHRTETGKSFQKYRTQEDSLGMSWLAMAVDEESLYRNANEWKREECMAFIRDVSDGLLDHIAGWLEARAAEADSAAYAVESAIPGLE